MIFLDNSGIINIDTNKLKKKVAEKLGLSLSQLNAEIEKIKAETDGVAGDRTALLIIMERWGLKDKDLIEEIVMGDSISPIQELYKGSKVATVLARVMRILPERKSRNENVFGRIIIEDQSGKALLYLFGRSLIKFKSMKIDIGDVIIVKRAKVRNKIGDYIMLIADDDSILEIPDESRFSEMIRQLPDPPVVLSVYEFLDSLEIFGEGDEINIEGVIESKSGLREFTRPDGKRGMVINLAIGDKNVPGNTIRLVAWDDVAKYIEREVQVGDIVYIYGAKIKMGIDQFGNSRLELHLGSFSSIKIISEKRVKAKYLSSHPDERVVIYGVVTSNPTIRQFERGGEVRNYVVFGVGDDTGRVRVVVWDISGEESKFENLKVGDLVRIYGRVVVSDEKRVELHVQRGKNVFILPSDAEVDFDKNEILEESEKAVKIESTLITNLKSIPEEGFISIKGRVAMVNIPTDERLPCQLLIEDDEGNATRVIGWERNLFERIYGFGMGAKVIIKNLRVDKDKITGDKILKITKRTEIEKVEEPSEAIELSEGFTDARTLLAKRKVEEIPFLRDADFTYGSAKFIASVIMVNRTGKRRFCLSCGAPILEDQEICENGHVGPGEELYYVDAIIDDGVKSFEAIINTKAVGIDSEKEFLDYIDEILGKDVILEADPKIKRDGTVRLIVKKIEPLDYKQGIDRLAKMIENLED